MQHYFDIVLLRCAILLSFATEYVLRESLCLFCVLSVQGFVTCMLTNSICLLVHSQVTIIFVVSVRLFVCLFVQSFSQPSFSVVMYRNCPPLCTEIVMYRKRPNPGIGRPLYFHAVVSIFYLFLLA